METSIMPDREGKNEIVTQPGSSPKCWWRNEGRFWKQRWQEWEKCSSELGHCTWTECRGTLFHFNRSHIGKKLTDMYRDNKSLEGVSVVCSSQSIIRECSLSRLLLFQIFMGMSEWLQPFCMECSPKLLKTFRAGAWLHLPPSVISHPYWAGAPAHLYLCGCQRSLFFPFGLVWSLNAGTAAVAVSESSSSRPPCWLKFIGLVSSSESSS